MVASPGRLLQHKLQGNLFFSHIRHVVIDEVDTMLLQGFGPDIREVLRGVLHRQKDTQFDNAAAPASDSDSGDKGAVAETGAETGAGAGTDGRVQLVMATATLTKAVKAMLVDAQGGYRLDLSQLQVRLMSYVVCRISYIVCHVDRPCGRRRIRCMLCSVLS